MILEPAHGSLNRKVRDTVNHFLDEVNIMNSIGMFRDSMWPGGQLRPPASARSAEEKAQARDDANRMLSALIPGIYFIFLGCVVSNPHLGIDLAANMIGRSNARRGARRIFAVLQNRRLNQHLAYTILDEVRTFIVRRLDVTQ
jgi:sorting nexin-25